MDANLYIRHLTGHGRGPFTLVVAPGRCTVLSGASGTGKSLLLRMIADLDPNEGEVRIGKTPRDAMTGPAWRREVTYVAAESGWWADDVRSHFTDPAAAERLLGRLLLRPDILSAAVSHLSTGERQRLALIRALVRRPRFLLLDEPTSGLDADTTMAVEALLRDVMSEGIGLLVVSHNTAQAARLRHAQFHLRQDGLESLPI
ncbi:ABC transporter ATP-binding protein [Cupriavidus sp. RAF12]|uniref:ABC transporter ATP-binding protein n=1 Tax=Cupriavidus sp. RAF12 TaxID=3233050 RepID=UPI003F9221D0